MSFADELAEVIRTGIETPEPHYGMVGSGVFDGSLDWHSSVHGHWALACMGRVLARPQWRAYVDARLTPEVVASEIDFLRQNPYFEKPYGRSWFVLLLKELSRTRNEIRPQLDMASEEMREWLRESAFPEVEGGDLLGTHNSWLFALFLMLLADPNDHEFLNPLIKSKLDPVRDKIAAFTHRDYDFLDLHALSTTVGALKTHKPGGLSFQLHLDADDPEPTQGSGHACGRAAVCMWPDAVDAALGATDAEQRFASALENFEKTPGFWRENFAAISHWVPQFVWMAMWLRDGRP